MQITFLILELQQTGKLFPIYLLIYGGGVIGGVAVPFFFMMSAYWLFRFDINASNAINVLIKKMQRKIRTICIPYLLWNTFGMVFYMITTQIPFVVNQMNNGEVIPLNLSNVIEGVIFHKYYFTFWYLQDLIILTAVSPVLLVLMKNKFVATISIVASVSAVLLDCDFILIKGTSLLFFLVGGYAVTYARKFFENNSEKAWMYFLFFVMTGVFRYVDIPIIAELSYYASPILLWKSVDMFLPVGIYERKMRWFTTQSFFIYASHVIPVTVIGHLLAKVSRTYWWATVSYLLAPWVTLSLIYVVAEMLYRYTPRFYGLICGGRIRYEQ